jgi:AraC-like DNA-binding protein
MRISGPSTDETLREIREHGTLRYPIEFYHNIYDPIDMTNTALHWHREYELVYVLSGTLSCHICCGNLALQAGQAIWVAPGILHGYDFEPDTQAATFVFLPELFAAEDSLLFERFVQPLRAMNAEYCLMDGTLPWHTEALAIIRNMMICWSGKSETRELDIQLFTGQFWSLLFKNRNCMVTGNTSEATMRMQARYIAMTEFIAKHYQEKLLLEQIARAANISRSEALRCFRTLAGQTPVEYLLNHRLRQAQRLLTSTEKTITEIAQASGFESVAYFDRVFRRTFGCTPRQMRRKTSRQP